MKINMKKLFFLLACSPLLLMAQKKSPSKTKTKKVVTTVATTIPKNTFLITGTLEGIADGTVINLLNGGTGTPEQSFPLKNKRFSFAGSLPTPDFKVITVEGQNDYLTMFIENSNIKISAVKDKLAQAVVTGSAANSDFVKYSKIVEPFNNVFANAEPASKEIIKSGSEALNNFIAAHSNSFITPMAIYRSFQLTADELMMDKQYRMLTADVKNTNLGQFVNNAVVENAKHPLGKAVANFSQLDTAGNAFSLESLKGKYVLLDFWASWCRPCRQENPNVVLAYNTYKNKNFTILGISLDQAKPAWLDAIKMDNLNWPHVSDLKGWGNEVAAMYNVRSIPQNFLIDPNGILIAKNLRGEALQRKLAELIN